MNLCSVILILFSGASVNISLLALIPFLPTMLAHESLDSFYNGLIISCFSIPYVFSPSIVANYFLPTLGRVNTFVLGAALMGSATLIFSVLDFIPSKPGFVVAAMITELINGSGAAFV